ncbi:hypothetical protein GCWU000324_00839 [Kingella oralis ATCC 51147]|uniref:Uncharacterized protein n=1 Tax=Kingella oralis ATCC 51147 TaxID=629741 RepID=C4GFC2_9NEIS|nr:hypothetical protein GCWU000324_00839 [Kingella oralis ATCC 51147]
MKTTPIAPAKKGENFATPHSTIATKIPHSGSLKNISIVL